MRRIVVLVLLVVAVGGVLLWMRSGSDEELIRAQLTRLAAAVSVPEGGANPLVRGAKMRGEFAAIFDEDVRANVPEFPSELPNKRSELADTATQLSSLYPSLSVELVDIVVKLDDAKQSTHVGATAKLQAQGRGGHASKDSRAIDFLFNKHDGTWRIASVTVWAKGE